MKDVDLPMPCGCVLISCVGERWVQAGLRSSQRRLREAGSAASALRGAEQFLEWTQSEQSTWTAQSLTVAPGLDFLSNNTTTHLNRLLP